MRYLALILLTACGYRFVVPNAPAGVKSVSVPVFQNATTEPQVDALCTQALREHYQRAGVLGGEGSDATVEGVVMNVSSAAFLAAPERGAFPTYRLSGAVRLTLRAPGRPPREVVVSGNEEYPSGADLLITESNRATALHRWCDALMREGAERLAD
ncbi:MAG: LptE family protein [Myxococcota bacterium]